MTQAMSSIGNLRHAVAESLERSPIIGVVRTHSHEEAAELAGSLIANGIELVEITFTVPQATDLVVSLLRRRKQGPPWIGMGTVTTAQRAEQALAAGAEFVVSPNTSESVAQIVRRGDAYLVLGALTPTEAVRAHELDADIIKVYPLPPIGGPAYLATMRQPLGDLPMLAAGGYPIKEISAYRAAGASAFGIGAPLLGAGTEAAADTMRTAMALARGEKTG